MQKATYLALFFLIAILACKKNGGKSNCQVAAISLVPDGGSPQAVNFTYDDQGQLKFVNSNGTPMEYWHGTNSFRRRVTTGGGWFTNTTIELNSKGLPTTKKDSVYNRQNLSQVYITSFEYDGQGQLVKTFKDNNPAPQEIFTWTGGNLVKYQSGNTVYFLEYFTDKTNRDFTFIDLQLFVNLGMNPAKSKNLLRSLTGGGSQLTFLYKFDGSGNIERWDALMTGSPDTVITTTQQFICD